MQWAQDPNQSNVDDLNNGRREASRHSGNKNKEYLKAKIDELETNSKIKNIRYLHRCINDFKKGYQLRTNRLKDDKVTWLQTPTVFWLLYYMGLMMYYMGLMMLCREKYTE